MAHAIMVVGTSSNVGKSAICTALCKILADAGYRVAPFKAQNMSLNAAVTPKGAEIGRAQAVQAEACGIEPNEHMNPVLLKPTAFNASQVVLQGQVYGTKTTESYFREQRQAIWAKVEESYRALEQRFDVIVIEGAGSPVEINLKEHDIANMRVADMADADVILVADIDRGGVFASVVGTLALLSPAERARVKGVIVNKFRGNANLFAEGVRMLEELAGVPVLGLVPYVLDIGIDEEDSLGLAGDRYSQPEGAGENLLQIGVVQVPHISNFNDFDPLFAVPGVSVRFCQRPQDLAGCHAVILPGTKNTIEDLRWLQERGFFAPIWHAFAGGAAIVGICGGYQMLGIEVEDPFGVESGERWSSGLHLLPVRTVMAQNKATYQAEGETTLYSGIHVSGYEIHMGETLPLVGTRPFAQITRRGEGVRRDDGAVWHAGRVVGTYLHGVFDNDAFREAWLQSIRGRFRLETSTRGERSFRERRWDAIFRFADVVRANIDTATVRTWIEQRASNG
ncbi:cobyric acid synthase [Alicyclobacillus hesperidum]|uniref:Cobyric acid synthase n=1 Tax=Alicyclobacillus hesperidum TaxID=89784 RepID=A0AA37X3R5_9BACL|nr:cobyric acid synthase [Alicyclobacillus hesperidum]GLV12517.1 cobyric acid synthase [Alicyclobacillus hesperidum]